MKNKSLENLAKSMALETVNKNRQQDGVGPLKQLPVSWWKNYGARWMEAAQEKVDRLGHDAAYEAAGWPPSDLPPLRRNDINDPINKETQHKIMRLILLESICDDTKPGKKREDRLLDTLIGAATALQCIGKLPPHWHINITCGRTDRLWAEINYSAKKPQ